MGSSTPSALPDGLPASSPAFNSKASRGREAGGQYRGSLLLGKEKALRLFKVTLSKQQVTPGKCAQTASSFKKELITTTTDPQLQCLSASQYSITAGKDLSSLLTPSLFPPSIPQSHRDGHVPHSTRMFSTLQTVKQLKALLPNGMLREINSFEKAG